jgi:hypothetical protein
VYEDDDGELEKAARDKVVFRAFNQPIEARLPRWYWLLFAAGFVLLLDVMTRRLAVDTAKLKAWFVRSWLRLRGQVVPEPEREVYFDRLQARKAQAGDRAARRFEAGTLPAGPVPAALDAAAPQPGALPRPVPAEPAKPAAPEEDVMSRLARAKKKIMEERKKDK